MNTTTQREPDEQAAAPAGIDTGPALSAGA